jgi:hypothetical protein
MLGAVGVGGAVTVKATALLSNPEVGLYTAAVVAPVDKVVGTVV